MKIGRVISVILTGIVLFSGAVALPKIEEFIDNSMDLQSVETGLSSGVNIEASEENPSKTESVSSEKEGLSSNQATSTKTENTYSKNETSSKKEGSSSKQEISSKTEKVSSKEETSSKTVETSSKAESISSFVEQTESQSAECFHTKTTIKNQTNATCTEEGYSGDVYCSSCGKVVKIGSQTKATGHKEEVRNQKSATATTEGYSGDRYCKICNIKLATGEAIPQIKEESQQETVSKTVYITKTGKRYHSTKNCPGLSKAKAIYDSSLENAKEKGLTPCLKCY